MTQQLRELAQWLAEAKLTAVAMEATGIYWVPVSWLKALTAAELLCVVETPVFTGNSSSSTEAVLVFQPAMAAPTGVIWAQVPGLEYLTKIHRR
jgi:hypothetical protein